MVALVLILMNYHDLGLREVIIAFTVLIMANLIVSWILESVLL